MGFLTEFSAGMLGILFGFGIERNIELKRKTEDKKDLIKDIKEELIVMKEKLSGNVYLLYPDIWDSAVSSGQIRLLGSKKVRELATIYRSIKGNNYEAQRVRDAKEELEKYKLSLDSKQISIRNRYVALKNIHDARERSLSDRIDRILQKDWLM